MSHNMKIPCYMNKKSILSILIIGLLLIPVGALAATDEEIEDAIEKGLAWLADQQNDDGYWGTIGEYNTVAKTGLAVLKFETHAIDLGEDPLSEDYEYYDQVRDGLDYIFLNAHTIEILPQPAGDPDTDDDGIGVYFCEGVYRIYETGIAMMAIAASTHPDMEVGDLGSEVDGWTYEEVLQDAVDYIAFAQNEGPDGQGGWAYEENYDWSDNTNSGYAVLGLGYAQASPPYGFELEIPQFVKDELNIWIDYIQNDVNGGSGYINPESWINILKTGNLLYEMAFVGDTIETPRVIAAVDYIDDHFYDPDYTPGWIGPGPEQNEPPGWPDWPACYQAMYTTMKGLEVFGIDYISPLNDPSGIDWFDEFTDVIVAQQNDDGSWPNAPLFGAPDGRPWGWDDDQILSTVWALLTLEKAVPPLEITVYVDIKPSSWPNPINVGSKGVFAVAICGTEDFDVMTIDPTTVKIFVEGIEEGVSPIRWSYEDVATPYTGPLGGGHALRGDGYLDLVFHFDTQAVVTTLTLTHPEHVGETIPLIIKGNLDEESHGTAIIGQDFVKILAPMKGK